ncbi:Ketosteroid isomerase-related protein [Frankineae bacterium MT45]|nr:Ketosteroid isomerase-related protein [Frankineae bacterium MT45]
MHQDEAISFARRWVEQWNRGDLSAVLNDFADDVQFTSPMAALHSPDSRGTIVGKQALRRYWEETLGQVEDLLFTVKHVFVSFDTVVIVHSNQAGSLICETLRFADGLIVEGHAAYEAGST